MSPREEGQKTVATNRRARFDYEILERLEAGIVLTGSEVKSLRAGRASLTEAFARVRDGEGWLENLHTPPYELEGKRAQIERLIGKTAERGLSLVPIRLYFSHGLAKVEIGLAKGKRQFEKRQAIAEREMRREAERSLGRRE